jgi:antitoxin component YwqK of YwqJK toxin-antitoxin module
MKFLATAFFKGALLEQDFDKAMFWFGISAEYRNINSMVYLGIMYRDGLGVEPDIRTSYFWFTVAGILKPYVQGEKEPEEFAKELEVNLSSDDIQNIVQDANAWIQTHPEREPQGIPNIVEGPFFKEEGVYYDRNTKLTLHRDTDARVTGVVKDFYETGQLERISIYKDGKPHGVYDYFYENGQLKERATFKEGKRDGAWEHYNETGQLNSSGNFKDGQRDGLFQKFDENGQLEERATYKKGELNGLAEWFDNGRLEQRARYKKGNRKGVWEYYDENGQLKKTENYKNELNFVLEYFDADGNITSTEEYIEGKRVVK